MVIVDFSRKHLIYVNDKSQKVVEAIDVDNGKQKLTQGVYHKNPAVTSSITYFGFLANIAFKAN
jgi:hypothetical protein